MAAGDFFALFVLCLSVQPYILKKALKHKMISFSKIKISVAYLNKIVYNQFKICLKLYVTFPFNIFVKSGDFFICLISIIHSSFSPFISRLLQYAQYHYAPYSNNPLTNLEKLCAYPNSQ